MADAAQVASSQLLTAFVIVIGLVVVLAIIATVRGYDLVVCYYPPFAIRVELRKADGPPPPPEKAVPRQLRSLRLRMPKWWKLQK